MRPASYNYSRVSANAVICWFWFLTVWTAMVRTFRVLDGPAEFQRGFVGIGGRLEIRQLRQEWRTSNKSAARQTCARERLAIVRHQPVTSTAHDRPGHQSFTLLTERISSTRLMKASLASGVRLSCNPSCHATIMQVLHVAVTGPPWTIGRIVFCRHNGSSRSRLRM